jgi:ABC-type transporter Mla subunit MlaD
MATDPTPSPLDLLQRAQFLHDSTLRRHSDALERHETQLVLLRQMGERQERLLQSLADLSTQLTDTMDGLRRTLDAIKDMLGRANGR